MVQHISNLCCCECSRLSAVCAKFVHNLDCNNSINALCWWKTPEVAFFSVNSNQMSVYESSAVFMLLIINIELSYVLRFLFSLHVALMEPPCCVTDSDSPQRHKTNIDWRGSSSRLLPVRSFCTPWTLSFFFPSFFLSKTQILPTWQHM